VGAAHLQRQRMILIQLDTIVILTEMGRARYYIVGKKPLENPIFD
jgi:hypothetical protein